MTDPLRRRRLRLARSLLSFICLLLVSPAVTLSAHAAESAEPLSESEQLDLLEHADAYYRSPTRENAEAIRLYEEVLEKVELADPIRLETMFRVANMHLFQMGPGLKGKRDVPRALAKYLAIIEQFPENELTVFRAHGFAADCYLNLDDEANAEKEYLYVRRFARTLPEDQARKYGPYLDAWEKGALANVVSMYKRKGAWGAGQLNRMAEENANDTELAEAARVAVAAFLQSHPGPTAETLPESPDIVDDGFTTLPAKQDGESAPAPGTVAEPKGTSPRQAPAKGGPADPRALPTAPDAEESRVLESHIPASRQMNQVKAYQYIIFSHDVPVCFESTLVTDKRAPLTLEFEIRKNQTLAYSLAQFEAASGGAFEAKRIRKVLCIVPTDRTEFRNDPFARRVSLKLDHVSAWEAFKALGKAMNAGKGEEYRGVGVYPQGIGTWRMPPRALLEERTISLDLRNVPAREAACAIIAAAPFQMSFCYLHCDKQDSMSIAVYKDGKMQMEGRLTREDNDMWGQEIHEASNP